MVLTFILFFCYGLVRAQEYASVSFSEKVISSFSQGDKAVLNTGAISLLKCTIATFGLDNVLRKTESVPGGWAVTLRNGEEVQLSLEELSYVKSRCGFKLSGDEQVFDKAIFLYAIMAKRTLDNSTYPSCHYLSQAVTYLQGKTNRIRAVSLVGLLGLNFIPVDPGTEICYVHQQGGHAVFACYGFFDRYGKRRKIGQTRSAHNGDADFILANFVPAASAVN